MHKLAAVKGPSPSAARCCNPAVLVTALVMAAALMSLAAQLIYTAHPEVQFGLLDIDQYGRLSLWLQDQRATELRKLTDPIERDKLCIANSAVARQVDKFIPPHARVFVDGVLGQDGEGRSAMYLFLQNYLFPRSIEISLDGRAVLAGNVFRGTPCNAPENLRAQGFDYLVQVVSPETVALVPLTKAGATK
jgi:hypothetical protein